MSGEVDWERVGQFVPELRGGVTPEYLERKLDESPEIMLRLVVDLYDSIKRDQERAEGRVRLGRRPKPTDVPLEVMKDAVFRPSYSLKPFPQALAELMGSTSQREFAKRIPVHQSSLSRLLSGEMEPAPQMLESVARACSVSPFYFVEWRAIYIAQLVASSYIADPKRSVGMLRALADRLNKGGVLHGRNPSTQ